MFAARADQENLAYAHQTAAAAKPLNQAKTPSNKAPKTPFRRNLNDENDNDAFQSGFKSGKATTKAHDNDNAFLTPAPRSRAPLGMKTTNAKAKTPAPLTAKPSAQKTLSPRLRRPKVKIHQAEPLNQDTDDGVPDIEYMPPRSTPLPDYPDTLHEQDWSMLKPENLANGYWGVFANAPGEDGLRPFERKDRDMMARTDKMQEDIIRRALEADEFLSLDLSKVRKELDKKKQQTVRAPSSLSARRAATALSRPASAASAGPRFAAPTATAVARSRTPSAAPMSRRPLSAASTATAPVATSHRHAAATAASRSTLGYSKGRAVSATARRPLSAVSDRKPATPVEKKTRSVLESLLADDTEVEQLLRERSTNTEDDIVDPLGALSLSQDDEDDEFKDFQLTMSE